MKKILAIIPVFAFAFASFAMPTSANQTQKKFIDVRSENEASIHNKIFANSSTGSNLVEALKVKRAKKATPKITTGEGSAVVTGGVSANENKTTVNTKKKKLKVSIENENEADIHNEIEANSFTGDNKIEGKGEITTGSSSASADHMTVVNSNVTEVSND